MTDLHAERRLTMLEEITQAPGIPGYESVVAETMSRWMEDIAEVQYDGLGSAIFTLPGQSEEPRVMLAGHMDEVGFMVKRITPEGFIKFLPIGGWWDQVLLGNRVIIKTLTGDVPGIIGSKPPHILSKEDREKVVKAKDMFIDIGATSDKVAQETMGVRPGDPILPFSPFARMANEDLLMSKAWDDRVGCALIIDVFHRLKDGQFPGTLIGVGTVQEEVGLRGAQTSAELVRPDVAIALEVSIAGDMPGGNPDEASDKLGEGPALLLYDRSMIPNLKLRDLVMEVARVNDIPLQTSVMAAGGTDAGRIHLHRGGVPSVVLGVPSRYIHDQAGLISLKDYERALDLLAALIQALDADTVRSLRP